MKKKAIAIMLAGVFFLLGLTGCGKAKAEKMPECDISMQTVTQSSQIGYVDCTFSLPPTWTTASLRNFGVTAHHPVWETVEFENEAQLRAYTLTVDNYYRPDYSVLKFDNNLQQIYGDLFAGKTESYQNHLNEHTAFANECLEAEKLYDSQGETGTGQNAPSRQSASGETERYIQDFNCRFVQGDNGRIAVVTFRYLYDGVFYSAINCIREDIPYMVSGDFNDTLEVSSGDIALHVANSLQVVEHFSIDAQGNIQPE